jgi:hypothetical protein
MRDGKLKINSEDEHMETMGIEKLRRYEPLNETEDGKVQSIKESMLNGSFSCPPILVWEDRDAIITGSHRVVACDELYREANMSANLDNEQYIRVMDLQIPVIDVSRMLENVDEDDFQYDNLRKYFNDTQIEQLAKQNNEW